MSGDCALGKIMTWKPDNLASSEVDLRRIMRAAPLASVVLSLDGAIQLWNPAAESLFGWREDEVLGGAPPMIAVDQQVRFAATVARARAGETTSGVVLRCRRHDNRSLAALLSAAPLPDAAGDIRSVIVVLVDVTALEEVRLAHMRMQMLSHQLLNAQEAERRRLAHDLHDEIGQALTAIKIGLEVARDDQNPVSRAAALDEVVGMVDDALQQVRNLALDLRPPVLDDLGLVAALRWHVERQAQRGGFATSFHAEGPRADALNGSRLPAAVEIACFRAAQEAITNIMRHAHACHVSVVLRADLDELTLLIRDDGVGFDVRAAMDRAVVGGSLGLLGMRERVELLGGSVAIIAAPGHGAAVQIRFPLGAAAAAIDTALEAI